MYRYVNIGKKGILNKREHLGQVWPADDIPFCSIFTYFQYSLIHDLALCFQIVKGKGNKEEELDNKEKFVNSSNVENFVDYVQ